MSDKKSFGEYITQKRKDSGLTQKSFAEQLFVTESAVSKWERGLSYPDIMLIRDICKVLNITEHELLTASEDTETRNVERQAKKYLKLLSRFKYAQYFIYGIAFLVCLICNIAVNHTVSWVFIVLTAELVAMSLTLLPVLVTKNRGLVVLAAFTISLLLLLLVCCLYTQGDWFLVAAISVIFGMTVVFLPIVLNHVWLPQSLDHHKALLSFSVDTVLLFILLLICDVYSGAGRFFNTALPIAAFCLLLPWSIMLILRYARMNGLLKTAGCLAAASAFEYCLNGMLNAILDIKPYGFGFQTDFRHWSEYTINGNVNALIFFSLLTMAILFAIAGVIATFRVSSK